MDVSCALRMHEDLINFVLAGECQEVTGSKRAL